MVSLPVSKQRVIHRSKTLAMVCARMFLPPTHCGMIIDTGHDCPPLFRDEIQKFGGEMTWFRARDELTTRALNIYSGSSIG